MNVGCTVMTVEEEEEEAVGVFFLETITIGCCICDERLAEEERTQKKQRLNNICVTDYNLFFYSVSAAKLTCTPQNHEKRLLRSSVTPNSHHLNLNVSSI